MANKRDPRTKEEFLNRMLSFDFDGDIRHLGVETATVQRLSPNSLRLKFPDSDQVFDLSIHKPREFAKVKAQPRTFTGQRDQGETRIEPPEARDGDQEQPAKRTRAKRKDAGQPRKAGGRRRGEARAQG